MSLLQMSFAGAVMITAVIIIRALAVNRLPKKTFLILWGIVLMRLLVPFSIPSELSVYSLAQRNVSGTLPGEELSEQASLTERGEDYGIDMHSDTDGLTDADMGQYGAMNGDRIAILPERSSVPTDGEQRSRSENRTDKAAIDDTENGSEDKVDKSNLTNAADRPAQKNDTGVSSDRSAQSAQINDTSVIFGKTIQSTQKDDTNVIYDAKYSTTKKTDSSVISTQTLQSGMQYLWERVWQSRRLFSVIWLTGFLACALYFAVSYLRCRFEFQASLPVENDFVQGWLQQRPGSFQKPGSSERNALVSVMKRLGAHRGTSVRQSDRISTPLTYGIFHPVILMPKSTDWENAQQLQYVLTHEYVHICRFDALTKLLVTCALCIHWFNPMVWIMWLFFNRDVEISCDESVVRRMGESSRSAYAMMLIRMEADRSGVAPLCSGLLSKIGKNAMEERITAIMKMKKKSTPAVVAAAILVISVTMAFATSAAENKNTGKKESTAASSSGTGFSEEEYKMLLALRLDGCENMTISEYRDKVRKLTDTEQYSDIIDRFFRDETIYARYETMKGTDSKETYDFLYNVFGPVMSGQQTICFGGNTVTDFISASENASLEYTVTLDILDPDSLSIGEYISARRMIEEEMGNILQGLFVGELRDEEFMKVHIDECIQNITMTYQSDRLHVGIEYKYAPLNGVAVDEMEDWQKERRDEWDEMMAPYVPFGLTYDYDWDTDDYKMFFDGTEVRGIYDEEKNVWISEHAGIGEDIYAADAIELVVLYEDHKIVGLRKANAQEMAEITERRQAVTDEHRNEFQEIRRTTPATEEDYRSLFTLKTADYQQRTVADFNAEYLDWCNNNYERMDRISEDHGLGDYRAALTEEERSFVELTTWLSNMENAEYVRSITKNEPEQDICTNVYLSGREESAQNGYGMAWCSLDYCFSYHIADKEKVTIGERDGQIGKMMREIQDYWASSDIDEILQMTESDMSELLHAAAKKYSSRNITITILDDGTRFECMDERGIR